jgi:D-3-phosphoglycerate dehydrogenase
MRLILANDGIDDAGREILEKAGFRVQTEKVAQNELAHFIAEKNVVAVLVRSATQITEKELKSSLSLRVIGRAGVGLDNIDLKTAEMQGVAVVNTPAASSQSVAELVLAHLFALARFIHVSNREMPLKGTIDFSGLKKNYSDGWELSGKTIGIIGFGRIGQALAKMVLGLGMKVMMFDPFVNRCDLEIELPNTIRFKTTIESTPFSELITSCDIISFHVPKPKGGPMIGKEEISAMKNGVILLNASRGGVIDEVALLEALATGKVGGAGLDVFEKEPTRLAELLCHPRISVTPHIGASTSEAQERIAIELAEKVIAAIG